MTKLNEPVIIEALPTTAAMAEAAEAFEATIQAWVPPAITSPEAYVVVAGELQRNKGDQARLKAELAKITDPLNESLKAARALFAPALAILTDNEAALKKAILAWQQEQERQRRELQARLDQEQREREAKAEAQAKKLEAKGKVEQAEAVRENVAPAAIVVVEQTKVKGIATRTDWSAEVTNFMELLIYAVDTGQVEAFFLVDEKKLNAYARSFKDKAKLPGVRFIATEGIAAGKR